MPGVPLRATRCGHCGVAIGQRPTGRPRKWCSKACWTIHARETGRTERVLKAIARRPRCMICGNPIQYGKPGVKYSQTTCSEPCYVKRRSWFVRPSTRAGRAKRKAA